MLRERLSLSLGTFLHPLCGLTSNLMTALLVPYRLPRVLYRKQKARQWNGSGPFRLAHGSVQT